MCCTTCLLILVEKMRLLATALYHRGPSQKLVETMIVHSAGHLPPCGLAAQSMSEQNVRLSRRMNLEEHPKNDCCCDLGKIETTNQMATYCHRSLGNLSPVLYQTTRHVQKHNSEQTGPMMSHEANAFWVPVTSPGLNHQPD